MFKICQKLLIKDMLKKTNCQLSYKIQYHSGLRIYGQSWSKSKAGLETSDMII